MPSTKALLFCSNEADSVWLAEEFERRAWDAEPVTVPEAFDRAVQWWKPDVVLISVDNGMAQAKAAHARVLAQPAPALVFLFGARPHVVMDAVGKACGASHALSSLDDLLPVVDAACAAFAAQQAQLLDGPGGFAETPEETVTQAKD